MRRVLILLAAAVVLPSPLTAKALDSINWSDRAAWNCAKTVAVRPFPVTGEFKGPKSQEEYMRYFVSRLAAATVRPGGVEKIFLVAANEEVQADAVITGEFTELSVGSRAARFWVGFGAGTAKAEVRIQAFRSDERTPIFNLAHARIAPFSLSEDANIGDLDAVAADIGEELLRRREPCDPSKLKLVPAAAAAAGDSDAGTRVSIEASVENAEVYVDGNFVGNAPLPDYRLSAGDHLIEVRARGYDTWKRELSVAPNAASRIVAQLQKSPE